MPSLVFVSGLNTSIQRSLYLPIVIQQPAADSVSSFMNTPLFGLQLLDCIAI